jgi:DNA-directed RNA polymerase subunit M/transcription elongation factor TFIIS
MEFCTDCNNLLVLKTTITENETQKAYLVCRKCEDTQHDIREPKTYFRVVRGSEGHALFYESLVNEYTAFDNTLPETDKVKCCFCSSDKPVKFFMIPSDKIKFLYQCKSCLSAWIMKDLRSGYQPQRIFSV